MRKGVMTIAAAVALGAATIGTGAMAAHGGGGGGGHGGGGGGAGFSAGGHGGGGGASFGGNAHMGGGGAPMAGPRASGTFNGGASFNSGARFNSGPRFSSGPRFNSGPRFSGGNFAVNGGRFGRFGHRHFRRGFGPGFGLFAFGGGPWWDSCWRLRRVWTPWGWHWRRINVCGWY